jgi:hypothetical protein
MSRVLGIELRRSAALGSGLVLLLLGVVLLFLVDEAEWTDGWMQLVMTQRLYLAVLWPLALAAGAFQARREHLSNVTELFTSTPRPRAHRSVPTLGAMAIAVVCGYLAMALVGALWIIGTADYLPVAVFVVTAVGAVALVAAVWLGLAVGRLLPWLITAPALGVAGVALLLLIPAATRPRGWLALVFSPIYEMNMPGPFAAVPGRASAAQTVWLAGLAVTAVLLFAAGGRRTRVAALLPVVLGAALAITVMPHQNRFVNDAIDPVAKELVCAEGAPRVCVSRAHAGLLSEVTPRAREGLATLAKVPGAPVEVHEDTTTYFPDAYPAWRADVVLLDMGAGKDGHLAAVNQVPFEVVLGAFATPPLCHDGAGLADSLAATAWLMGREPAARSPWDIPEIIAEAVQTWRDLNHLPVAEATARVAALRDASVHCRKVDGDLARSSR